MGSIGLRGVSVLTPHPLFRDLDLVVGDGDRIGLVAGNGGGKSTLLRCLAGLAEPTAGTIVRSRGLRVAHVAQEVPDSLLGLTMAEAVRRALPPDERASQSWRVDLVLDGLATPEDLRERPVAALSGGWQRLAMIARAWIADPDLLLLDEPTNHLDGAGIERLERWIVEQAGGIAMVVASHDRRFLDETTTRTLFLRPERSRLYAHPYSRARALLAADDAADEARFARDRDEVERLRRSAGELRNIGINSRSDAAQRKSMLMAKRADGLERTLRPAHAEKPATIRLDGRAGHARTLVALDDVSVKAPDGRALFRTGQLRIGPRDRIVLLGANGVGKSSLVALLRRAASEPDDVPGVRIAPSLTVGYLDQEMSQLPGRETPFDVIAGRFRLGDRRSQSLLAGAGFPVERQGRPIDSFSPGQKARLGLLVLRLTAPGFYLLDEPTNHLDIPGREQLEAEIAEGDAAAILVTHDRAFADAVATRRLLVEKGRLREVEG
ncbi:MAG: ABC-F family ATP-binding cassette domain-containing protein [Alphaproteobacteria bacterium]